LGFNRECGSGGFMFAATHSLVAEGVTISPARLVAGMVIGLVGILIGKMLIVEREHPASLASSNSTLVRPCSSLAL
jgi:hypothetical protein